MPPTPPTNKPSRIKRLAWGLFCWVRTTLLVLLLFALVVGLFLNKVGLPEFVKNRVIAQAREKGLEVEFSRLRLLWYRGIVAENLHVKGTNGMIGPHLFVENAESPLSPAALRNFALKLNALRLSGGRLIWPLAGTNEPGQAFVLNDLNGQVAFHDDGLWELRSFHGNFHGIKLELVGTLANAASMRKWKIPQRTRAEPSSLETVLHEIEKFSGQLKMSGDPDLRLRFRGDGNDLSTLGANLYFSVPELSSPWGAGTNLVLFGQLLPPATTNETPSANLKLTAGNLATAWGRAQSTTIDLAVRPVSQSEGSLGVLPLNISGELDLTAAETRWGSAGRLSITAHSAGSPTNAALTEVELTALGHQIHSDWVKAVDMQLTATASHSVSNWMPANVSADLRLDTAQNRWGEAQSVRLRASGALPPADQLRLFNTNLVWPDRIENLPFEATASLNKVQSQKVMAENIFLAVDGRTRQLRLVGSGKLGGGEITVGGQLDAATRNLSFSGSSTLDPRKITPFLSTNTQQWLASYTFGAPPKLEARGHLVLPPWTNRHLDWTGEVLPSISLAGSFEASAGSYRSVSFTTAQSRFALTNLDWQLPSLKLTRPEGALEAEYASNPITHDFHWRIHSQIDLLSAAKPLFQNKAAKWAFDFLKFTTPPVIDGEVWGRWSDLDRLGVSAAIAATNFMVRGEAVKGCQTRLDYTNQLFSLTDCHAQREHDESGSASGIAVDLRDLKLYVTNGFSTLNPYVVARAIGTYAIEAIAPYQFDSPPIVRVNGAVDLERKRYEEDLHFDVAGRHFHWNQFRLAQLTGRVDWVGQTLGLSNVVGAFDTGRLTGEAYFDFGVPHDADFSFKTSFTGADLREIAGPFTVKTNKLEGLLNGDFAITHANSSDTKTWQGHGNLSLRDGLIWDLPMFGVFSPVLNAFAPGLGNSRANEASATFAVTNGVFVSKDLEIRATMMRMQFEGAVGLNRQVDARVEAELLRDVPAVGFVISKLFWPVTKIFEYKVTGTLSEPKAEPLYVIPKVLLMPFHPLKSLKGIFLEEPKPGEDKKPTD